MEWLRQRWQPASGWLHWFMVLMAGLLVSVFVAAVHTPTSVGAASWSGQNINHEDATYTKITDEKILSALNLPRDVTAYGVKKGSGSNQTFEVIHVPANTSTTEPANATYVIYHFTPPDTYKKDSSSEILVEADPGSGGSECQVDRVGWIVCGLSSWIASGIDGVYSMLSDLMKTPAPDQSNPQDSIHMAWEIMRNIANSVFIISFIVIIYSQVTSYGISNYGIKKMLPRLIVAALLVNLSLMICVVFIDISNILGVSLQDMFVGIREHLVTNSASGQYTAVTWSDVTTYILSGGAIGAGLAMAGGGVVSSLTPLLVPLLLSIALALLLVFVVLAARQAIIIVLTIISPIAFVLYLLPGTEKWFEKWRETFFTMLLFFPAFSVIFGGAQLAGVVIIQNATGILMLLLGMAVQVAPLAIAPLVMKLGGGLLNRFAGIVNNPTKGAIDKSKQWAQNKGELIKLNRWDAADKKALGKPGQRRWYNPAGSMRRLMRNIHRRNVGMQKQLDNAKNREEVAFSETTAGKRFAFEANKTADFKKNAELSSQIRYEEYKAGHQPTDIGRSPGSRIPLYGKRRAAWDAYEKAAVEDLTQQLVIGGMRQASASRVQSNQVATALEASSSLRELAGYMEDQFFQDGRGSSRALGTARATLRTAREESIKNADAILSSINASNQEMSDAASLGMKIRDVTMTDDLRTASIRNIAGGKDAGALYSMLEKIDYDTLSNTPDFAQELGEALRANSSRPFWVGAAVSGQIAQNTITGQGVDNLKGWLQVALNTGKFSAEVAVSQDRVYLEKMNTMLSDKSIRDGITKKARAKVINQIEMVAEDSFYSGRVGEREEALEGIYKSLGGKKKKLWE